MTLGLAFLGGMVSCLSPCVLPVLPVFLTQLRGGHSPAGSNGSHRARAPAAGFLLGFTGVFVLLWIALGLGGSILLQSVPLLRLPAGLLIAVLGFALMVGWEPSIGSGRWRTGGSFVGSLMVGSGVAIGWTPCIGPTLGAILSLAAASDSVWMGAALLVAYAIGMVVPLVAVALGLGRTRRLASLVSRHHAVTRFASGMVMVVVGALVATNGFARLAGLVPWRF